MRKNTVHFVLDALSLVGMLAVAGTGLLMRFTLPPGSSGKTVWGLGRHDWGGIHFWIAVGLVAMVTLHVALHWTWVCASLRRLAERTAAHPRERRDRRPDNLLGLAFLALLVLAGAGFMVVARASVVSGPGDQTEPATERRQGGQARSGGGASGDQTGSRPLRTGGVTLGRPASRASAPT